MEHSKLFGNIWIFTVSLKSGAEKVGHKHEFDHIHQVVSGRATIICYKDLDEKEIMYEKEIEAGKYYKVPKNHVHRIIANKGVDYLGNCIHALRHEDGSVYDTNMIEDIDNGNIEYFPNKD